MVFEALNRLRWKGGLGDFLITIKHRGAPNDRKVISGSSVTELKKSYFTYEINGTESTIPLHRVLEITVGDEVIWRRRIKKG